MSYITVGDFIDLINTHKENGHVTNESLLSLGLTGQYEQGSEAILVEAFDAPVDVVRIPFDKEQWNK